MELNYKVIEIETEKPFRIARDVTSQYVIQKELDYVAQHDSLTDILNRFSFYNRLEYVISNSKRNKKFLIKILIGTIPIIPIGYIFFQTGIINQLRNLEVIG